MQRRMVGHVGAVQDGGLELCRLHRVVTPVSAAQAAADQRDAGQAIEQAQLADRSTR